MPGRGSQIQHSKVEEQPGEGEAGQGPFLLLVINQPSLTQPDAGKPRKHLPADTGREQILMTSSWPCRGGSWECGDCAVPPKLSHSLAGYLA